MGTVESYSPMEIYEKKSQKEYSNRVWKDVLTEQQRERYGTISSMSALWPALWNDDLDDHQRDQIRALRRAYAVDTAPAVIDEETANQEYTRRVWYDVLTQAQRKRIQVLRGA